ELRLHLLVTLAEQRDLAFEQGNRLAAFVGNLQGHEQLGLVTKKLRVFEQPGGNRGGIQFLLRSRRLRLGGDCFGRAFRLRTGDAGGGCHGLSCPSYTVVAGPVIHTGSPSPAQLMRRIPPRVWTSTSPSSKPRRRPATTAAQAPVPQARVSPAPRSKTLRRMVLRSTTCMNPAFTCCGKCGCCSTSGPSVPTGAWSTSSTTMTACGLPI